MAQTFPLAVIFSAIDRITGPLSKIEGRLGAFGKLATRAGAALTAGLTVPIVGFGVASTKKTLEFERALKRVGNVTGATARQLQAIGAAATELDLFAPTKAVEAIEQLALAGLSAEKSIRVLPRVADFATAAQLELADAAKLVGDSLEAYGAGAESVDRLTSALVVAQRRGNDINALAEALAGVGLRASQMDIPLERTIAMLGVLADRGKEGSEGATVLNSALQSLAKKGGKDLVATVENLGKSAATTADFMKLFGSRAGQAIEEAFSGGGTDAVRDFERAILDATDATKEAEETINPLERALKRLTDAWETLSLSVGIVTQGPLADAVNALAAVFEWLNRMPPIIRQWVVGLGAAAAALAPLLLGLGAIATSLNGLIALYKTLTAVQAANTAATLAGNAAFAASPVGRILAGLAVVTAAGVGLYSWLRTSKSEAPPTGATAAAAIRAGTAATRELNRTSNAHVAVSFQNLPRGTRVQSSGDAPIDLDMGFAMGAT